MDRTETIEKILSEALSPSFIEVKDESAQHAGHAEAKKSGGGHFHVTVVSETFANRSLVERHRLVNDALKSLFDSEIHALSLTLKTPDESNNPG